jgi:hypothetical protein
MAMTDIRKAKEPVEMWNLADLKTGFPARFASHATLTVAESGLPVISDEEYVEHDIKHISIVIIDGPMLEHYFHFVEILVGVFYLHQMFFPSAEVTAIFFGAQKWNNPNQNNVQRQLLDCIYPNAARVESPIYSGLPVENALVVERRAVGPSNINKFLDPFLTVGQTWARIFKSKVWAGIIYDPRADQAGCGAQAGYVARDPPRTFVPEIEERLLNRLDSIGYRVRRLEFANMTWHQQVQSVHSIDLMFGVHGNGLTNSIWMRPGGTVIEFFPVGCHHYDYQVMCELFGLRYFGFEGREIGGYVAREFSRFGAAYGEHPGVNSPIEQLPWHYLDLALTKP